MSHSCSSCSWGVTMYITWDWRVNQNWWMQLMVYPLTISNTDKSLCLSELSDTFRRSSAMESDSLSFGCRCLWFSGGKKNWLWSSWGSTFGRFPRGFGLLVLNIGRVVVVLLGIVLAVVVVVDDDVGNLILLVVGLDVEGTVISSSFNRFPFCQTSIMVLPLDSVKITYSMKKINLNY